MKEIERSVDVGARAMLRCAGAQPAAPARPPVARQALVGGSEDDAAVSELALITRPVLQATGRRPRRAGRSSLARAARYTKRDTPTTNTYGPTSSGGRRPSARRPRRPQPIARGATQTDSRARAGRSRRSRSCGLSPSSSGGCFEAAACGRTQRLAAPGPAQ